MIDYIKFFSLSVYLRKVSVSPGSLLSFTEGWSWLWSHGWWIYNYHMQSVPITTDVVSSNLNQGKVYNIMW
jgi:hypothetical protein